MSWTESHGPLLGRAFAGVLGAARPGAVAFVRCLPPEAVEALARDPSFAPSGWQVYRVADRDDAETRTVRSDRSVELREDKCAALLFLVDVARSGAGMDGIYSAAREVGEETLFREAHRYAAAAITRSRSRAVRGYAERAVRAARLAAPWDGFDYLCRIVAGEAPGQAVYRLGLWPIRSDGKTAPREELANSALFVERLLGPGAARSAPAARIGSLRLEAGQDEERAALERFLNEHDSKSRRDALAALAEKPEIWVGALRTEGPAAELLRIDITSWRNRGSVSRWSGLVAGVEDGPPELVLNRTEGKRSATLEVRWKAQPDGLGKGAAEYFVEVLTEHEEPLASRFLPHRALRGGEKCRFSVDDFDALDEDAHLHAKVRITAAEVKAAESEEFVIRFGETAGGAGAGGGRKVRTLSEGLIELRNVEQVREVLGAPGIVSSDSKKGIAVLRTPVLDGRQRSWRVPLPPLVESVESDWLERNGEIGRWWVRVRDSGKWAGPVEFRALAPGKGEAAKRAAEASRRMAGRFERSGGGVAQVYDAGLPGFQGVRDYLAAWEALLREGPPELALVHTVEVQSLAGRPICLVVLPAHPLRAAWLAAYDSLVLDARFPERQQPAEVKRELLGLDGAMFPAFLPNPDGGAFVFADTLGLHAVGMVPDSHPEPKAAVALLASAMANGAKPPADPTTEGRSAEVLGGEVRKYLDCHQEPRWLHLHALRAGDGFTVARALGNVRGKEAAGEEEAGDSSRSLHFALDLYPSSEQQQMAGRFLSEAPQRRRIGAGTLAEEDRWLLESVTLPGGITQPRLRWALKEAEQEPSTAAHLAVAFDTFESRVATGNSPDAPERPHHAFGLLSFYERSYQNAPSPRWSSTALIGSKGQKHPSTGSHTTRLADLHRAVHGAVARHLGARDRTPELKTEISSERAHDLESLHRLSDWVITMDRNAGIEYFDSPHENTEIYDAYVIDCVPEREDLGCLQLITSTANLDEVRGLLDRALDDMGLSRSRRNAEFLMARLKALSGRLAIRLTGDRPATSELIALALAQGNCCDARPDDACWTPLSDGFVVPVDDVLDLLPPLAGEKGGERADLIHVSVTPRAGLDFRFVEVKYRRHLVAARDPELLEKIRRQTGTTRKKWSEWYGKGVTRPFRAVRLAKLARVLRFYADRARRHRLLSQDRYRELATEIDRMVERGRDYAFGRSDGDRGWVFCPEYRGAEPTPISTDDRKPRIFLFGPSNLPNLRDPDPPDDRRETPPAAGVPGQGSGRRPPPDEHASPDGGASDEALATEPRIELGRETRTGDAANWALTVKGNPHLLVAGLPGMGKTTCLINLCRQMVEQGVRPIVFSYHSDIDQKLEKALAAVRFVDFDKLGFNPLHVRDRESRLAHLDVAGDLRDIFLAIFPELGDIQGELIRGAIRDSFQEKGWGSSGVEQPEEPAFQRFFELLRDGPSRDQSAKRLLARLSELNDYGLFDVGKARGSLWDIPEPAIIRIHRTQNDHLQRALASLALYGLYKDMFRRGTHERITHAIIFDEAHRAWRLKLIPKLAKECRKYGISLVLASQQAKDFDASVFSAIANYLVLRLTDADARSLVRNVASSREERLFVDQIKQLDRFRALYFSEERAKPYRIELPP